MIDRKLLKTNRWEDEEYLQARMTNACFNGGGGGDGGGADDDEAYEGAAMREHEERYGGGDAAESQAIEQQIAAQAAAQAQQQAIDAQMAREQAARQAQVNRASAAAAQAARQDRENAAAAAASRAAEQAAHVARQQGANPQEQEMAAQSAASRVSQDVISQVDSFAGVPSDPTGFTAREQERFFDPVVSPAGTDFFGGSPTAPIDFSRTQQGHPDFPGTAGIYGTGVEDFAGINNQAMRDIAADDYMGTTTSGFLDTTRSPIDTSAMQAAIRAKGLNADPMNVGIHDTKYGENHPWHDLSYTEKVTAIDRFNAGPSGIADMFNLSDASRMANLANSVMDNRVGPGHPDWDRGDPARDVRPVDHTGDVIGTMVTDGPVLSWTQPGWPSDGVTGPGFPPWPPGGGGGFWPPGGGGGYPPTWGAGRRTGGGMPGYMANYPIHSQNLFNFTPARAMPGIDPSYQPWMQPAQGMAHNLWNYQAPNLLPWDMTNRVPWNFATTPTGQYGPMVATVGGEPVERGDR